MKLRYFQTFNKNGVDSPVSLQYWDKETGRWESVDFIRVRESQEEEYMTKPPT